MQRLLKGLASVGDHRGGCRSRLGDALFQALRRVPAEATCAASEASSCSGLPGAVASSQEAPLYLPESASERMNFVEIRGYGRQVLEVSMGPPLLVSTCLDDVEMRVCDQQIQGDEVASAAATLALVWEAAGDVAGAASFLGSVAEAEVTADVTSNNDGREADDAAAPAPDPPGKRQKPNKSQRLKKQAARGAAVDTLQAECDAAMQASWQLGRRRGAAESRMRAWRDDVAAQCNLTVKAARALDAAETDAAAERGRAELETCERDLRTKLNGLNAAVADEARIEALAAVSVMRQGLEEPGASVVPEGVEAPFGGEPCTHRGGRC